MEKPVVRNVAKKKKPCTLGKHSPIDNSHISRVADTMIMNVPRLESVNNLSASPVPSCLHLRIRGRDGR